MLAGVLLVVALVPMALESWLSVRHERRLRAAGAVEPAGDVYRMMQVAYPACFVAMAAEGWLRGSHADGLAGAGAVVFVAAKALKYWAMRTLGGRWSFRVLVPPGSARVVSGPYAVIAHPNYVAVVLELAGMGLMAGAPAAMTASLAGFGLLLRRRIGVEERALGMSRGL